MANDDYDYINTNSVSQSYESYIKKYFLIYPSLTYLKVVSYGDNIATLKGKCSPRSKSLLSKWGWIDSTFDSWGPSHVETALNVSSGFSDTCSVPSDGSVDERRLGSEWSSFTLEACWHHVNAFWILTMLIMQRLHQPPLLVWTPLSLFPHPMAQG